jgi:hypothetical protein
VQEIFQAVTPLFYAPADLALPPLVLVGKEHWTETIPVWPAIELLGAGRPMERAMHLVDRLEEVLPLLPTVSSALPLPPPAAV